jgi:hypothetical protein
MLIIFALVISVLALVVNPLVEQPGARSSVIPMMQGPSTEIRTLLVTVDPQSAKTTGVLTTYKTSMPTIVLADVPEIVNITCAFNQVSLLFGTTSYASIASSTWNSSMGAIMPMSQSCNGMAFEIQSVKSYNCTVMLISKTQSEHGVV